MVYKISSKVINVVDDDTLTIIDAMLAQHKNSVGQRCCPESGRPYGNRAKQRLRALTVSKQARTDFREKDKYRRDTVLFTSMPI